jgi:DNA-binding GntR family transcriptional regulator
MTLEQQSDAAAELRGEGAVAAKPSLSEQVYRSLRLSLMSGAYLPGSKLNIRKLAESFAVSVTPVREAVFQLVREQALELKSGHQPRVPVLEIARYINLRETRVPLERLATELAVAHFTAADLDSLQALHARFVAREAAEDWRGALSANQAFHFHVYAASRNPVLVGVIETLWLLAGPFTANQYPGLRNAQISPHPHEILIDAIARKSAAEAGDAMVNDLRAGSYRLLQQMNAQAAPRRSSAALRRKKDITP